jgi:acetyl-CoA carboxylase carboxyl transferase subunit beta
MNWITNYVRPRIKSWMAARSTTPENLWSKCPGCGEMIFHRDLEASSHVCPRCGHHIRIGTAARFAMTFDDGKYQELPAPSVPADPLRFRDERRYTDRLKDARAKTGRSDALTAARGTLDGLPVMIAVQPFDFLGGSLGMGVGEALVLAMQAAVQERRPFILFVASGGARMQEGILSLMQMPRVTIGVDMLREAGLPYIVVLTDPTTGGVSASYAMLGDVHIAEPGALIGFAGQRVIEQTIREKLPEGFQRAEYLLQHGMVDMVVHRRDLRATLSRLVHLLVNKTRPEKTSPPAETSRAAAVAAIASAGRK